MKKLGRKINMLRRRERISSKQLADTLGLTKKDIHSLENSPNNSKLLASSLYKIANTLGTTMEFLMDDSVEREVKPKEKSFVNHYYMLDEKGKNFMNKILIAYRQNHVD